MDKFSNASATQDLRVEIGAIAKEIDAELETVKGIAHA